ncbi:MAG: chemotaxis protein CheC [Methanomicrobiales archaeon]|nr:chemotaxis protein CheC [Methanomicrobiales archaeon]MDI6877324.1 chemotaxis protein CheC [Methanomicrobiales archaeon]
MTLTSSQLDALNELGNIGAAHAATTLSQMLNTNIQMTVPEVRMLDIGDVHLHLGDEIAALVVFQIQGELSSGGFVLLCLPGSSAIRMTNTLLGMTDRERGLSEMDRSALLEIGNIMVSSFLDATAELLNIVMLPSPPSLAIDMPHAAMESLLADPAADVNEVVLFKTELTSDEHRIVADLMLLPNPPMLCDILRILERLLQPPA